MSENETPIKAADGPRDWRQNHCGRGGYYGNRGYHGFGGLWVFLIFVWLILPLAYAGNHGHVVHHAFSRGRF